jgi:hypothetical protein
MDNKRLILSIFVIFLIFLSGCAMVLRAGGAERKSLHYGYGEEGEFFYLQYYNKESMRFQTLAKKYIEEGLNGRDEAWSYGSSKEDVVFQTGEPIFKKNGYFREEWYYKFYILVFEKGKLVGVKSTGRNKKKEYIWLETWYSK